MIVVFIRRGKIIDIHLVCDAYIHTGCAGAVKIGNKAEGCGECLIVLW